MKNKTDNAADGKSALEKRRRKVEATATFGLLLVCAALVAPFASAGDLKLLSIFKWVYAAGAVIFLIARVVNVNDPADSLRLRRMRRMEAWAGLSLCVAAFFWFYNEHRLGPVAGSLAILQETILFTLAGAMIQIIASWLVYNLAKKEASGKGERKR